MQARGFLAVYCVTRDIRRCPRSWKKGREDLGMEGVTTGLTGACGGRWLTQSYFLTEFKERFLRVAPFTDKPRKP